MAEDMQKEISGREAQDVIGGAEPTVSRINKAFQARWNHALDTDEYETAYRTHKEVGSFKSWRDAARSSSFPQFYQLIEAGTLLNQTQATQDERSVIVDQLTSNAQQLSPRVRDLYLTLLSKLDESDYPPNANEQIAKMTASQVADLEESGDLAILQNPAVPWETKLNRIKTRFESELKGRRDLDKRDRKLKEVEEPARAPTDNKPPEAKDESKPGMDEMERTKEGEQTPAIWVISPAYGGYYKEQSFDTWDSSTNTWRQSNYDFYEESSHEPSELVNPIEISAVVPPGKTVRLPRPYTYAPIIPTLKSEDKCQVLVDQNGDFIIQSLTQTNIGHFIKIQYSSIKGFEFVTSDKDPQPLFMPSVLTQETEEKLRRVEATRKNDIDKARALASYTMHHLSYSNDSSFNNVYDTDPDGYIAAIDKHRQADCDVANTYFAALCSRLGIPARHVIGHMVKGKDNEGNSRITSGTGHAWTEVWDKNEQVWVRIDATPPGDPQMEQNEQSEAVPGDYGEQEAIGPTDEELQKLEEQLAQTAERLSYTEEERQLAEAAGVDLKEARQIVKEIRDAEETRLPNGEKIVDVLSRLWSLLAESRTHIRQEYTGPLRKREGGEVIEDVVAHKIGIKAGEVDPASREKQTEQIEQEQILSALQVHIIADKSGSMSQTVDGETKWRMQRRAIYLVLSSLDRAEKNFNRIRRSMQNPLDVSSQVVSFRDSSSIDVDKPVSNQFSAQDKVRLWQSLGNQGSDNGDVPALSLIYEQIKSEREELKKTKKEDDTLRVIIACSDGMPDNPAGVQELAQKLGEANTVVVGVGMTETASQVPIIFDTPYSRGDLAKDLNDLPAIVAKHIVTEAVKLFPRRARADYERQINAILAKFRQTGIQ